MPKINLRILCIVTTVLCIVQRSLEHGIPRRSFLSRRAVDGTRGRKYFDPNEDGEFDSYGSAGGQYEPYDYVTDLSDIRKNVPGEPGIDYPAYMTLPQTGFTCEGRSRGYYADEAAGCQVFHVCHDVLVSSFLCPIGSTFSQKLLTCDWWTKVDCSSTRRYLEVNRDSYQIDDDEMIRNAYAMISLQTSAEDATKDGLVDPDSGARIYSVLDGRTMGYTPGLSRITDFAPVEATGNDLPSGFKDYSQQDARQILNYNLYYQQKKMNAPYQGKFHFENKEQSPYHASAIIQHDYQDRSGNEFQNEYRVSDGFTNRLQTFYAPTVPTVTTTTRRFYSPTVPTTYRPSTLAYNKLDLMVDSSDHLYAHSKSSKSPMTPPTIIHQNDDMRKIDLRESETEHDLKKSENVSSSRTNKDRKDDNVHSKNDDVRSEKNFRINVTDAIDEDIIFRQQNDRPIIQNNSEESLEDSLETKDSIGIAQALNNPLNRIIQNQNPIYQISKNERKGFTTPIPSQKILNHSSRSYEKADDVNLSDTLKKLDVFNETSDDRSTEDYKDSSSSITRSSSYGTTSLLEDVDAVQVSPISITATSATNIIERNVDEIHDEIIHSLSNDNLTAEDQNLSPTESSTSFNDRSVPKINLSLEVPKAPAQFLKPPLEQKSFLINVPEETRYTTIDENSKTSWSPETTTKELSLRFSSTFENNGDQSSTYEEESIDYTDEGFLETPISRIHPTAQVVTEISTPFPWLVSTWHDRSLVNVPVTDIVPPIIDYNDGFGDFVPPNEHYTEQLDHIESVDTRRIQSSSTTLKKNDSEADILAQYNTGFQFTIRNAIKAQKELKENSSSSVSDKQENIPKITVSPSINKRIISTDTKATTRIPDRLTFLDNTKSLKLSESTKDSKLSEDSITDPVPESLTFTVKSSINSNINTDSNLKMITPRTVLNIKNPEKKIEKMVETTVNSLSSIHPTRIEETIDKHSPYKISFDKKDETLETIADDFISRLISQHQRSDSLLKELNDFEIVKSVEPETEITSILQTPKFFDTSHVSSNNANNDSFYVTENDTVSKFEQSDSDISMVSLLQLMAELLKLDRLPQPFSTKDLNKEFKDLFNLDLNESTYDATNSPLDYSQIKTTYKNASLKTSTLKTPVKFAESEASRNLHFDKSFATGSPLSDYLRARMSFGNADSKMSSLAEISDTFINIDLKPSSDVSSKVNLNVKEQKIDQSKSENRIAQSFQKEEILEKLTENFGQPFYHDNSIRKPFIFDLPQVQRRLNFETGLPIEENEHATNETEKENPMSTTRTTKTTTKTTTQETITTESVKTTVETEFVPSLGFSLDTSEGREEYVQAVLGGLIDEHAESDRNVSKIVQNKTPKNETLEAI